MNVDEDASLAVRSAARVEKVALLNLNPTERLRRGRAMNPAVLGVSANPTFKNANGPRASGVAASTLPQNIGDERNAAARPAVLERRNRPMLHDPRSSASETISVRVAVTLPGMVSTRVFPVATLYSCAGTAMEFAELLGRRPPLRLSAISA
jgi:hypothetical protein